MAVTLRDVAQKAGVSVSAVSHVMTGNVKAGIKAETRARVRQVAREMGYHPSAVARALVRRQTDTLGIVLPPTRPTALRDPYFSSLLDGVMQAAAVRSRDVMVFTGSPLADAEASIAKLRDGRCDNLILFHQPASSPVVPALLNFGMPCVMVGDWWDDPRLPCVDVENVNSSNRMTQYLLELGHRRIAFLSNEMQFHYVPLRLEGYRLALEQAGLSIDSSLIRTHLASWESSTVIEAVDDLMSLPPATRPSALCCTSDDIAALALAALSRRGLRVPEDVSVTGFNDDESALRQHPPLTTMRQPYEAMCLAAIDMMQSRSEASTEPGRLMLPAEFVERSSTGPVRPALLP